MDEKISDDLAKATLAISIIVSVISVVIAVITLSSFKLIAGYDWPWMCVCAPLWGGVGFCGVVWIVVRSFFIALRSLSEDRNPAKKEYWQ